MIATGPGSAPQGFMQQSGLSWRSGFGAAIALLLAVMAYLSRTQQLGFIEFASLSWAAAGFTFWIWYQSWRSQRDIGIWEVLGWALVFRLIGLYALPVLEDDYFRYLWDGFMLVETGSPYGIPPSAFFEALPDVDIRQEDKIAALLDGINHPDIATIYGPVCMLVFGLSYWIAPGEIWPLQLIFGMVDFAIIIVLSRLTHARNVLLYAWSPMVIKEFAFTAHTDVLAVLFVLLSLLAASRQSWRWMGISLAFALASKVFAIVIVPLLLLRSRRSWIAFIAILSMLYVPFAKSLFLADHGLTAMAQGWFFNAPLYGLILGQAPQLEWPLKLALAGLYGLLWCGIGWAWLQQTRRHQDKAKYWLPADLIFGAFLIILPAVNPWYLVWVLPFAALRPSLTVWAASVAVIFAYAIGLNLPASDLAPYALPNWALALEYGLIVSAAAVELLYQQRQRGRSGSGNGLNRVLNPVVPAKLVLRQ